MAANTLSLENEVFAKFAFYAAVVIFKTIMMSVWTARYRLPRNTPPLPEDYSLFTDNGPKTINAVYRDPDIERVRRCHRNDIENVFPFVLVGLFYVFIGSDVVYFRCHRNDLENVIPFVLIGLLYVLTGPDVVTATWHFRIFAACRLLYTFVFMNAIASLRPVGFLGGLGVNISMSIQVLLATVQYM